MWKQSRQDRVSYWVGNLTTDSCHFRQQNKWAARLGWKNPAWCLLPFKVKDQCVKFELEILGSNLPLDLQWRLWQARQQRLAVGVAKEIVNRWQRRAQHNSDHVIKNTATEIATNCLCRYHQTHTKASRASSLMPSFHLFTRAEPTFTQTALSPPPWSLHTCPRDAGPSLPPSACVRGCTGVSVMTMSRRSSLSISQAVITPTHMELSIRRLLHTGTPTTQRRERVRARDSGTTRVLPTAARPLAAPISSVRTVSFNYSDGSWQSHSSLENATKPQWSRGSANYFVVFQRGNFCVFTAGTPVNMILSIM